MTAALAPTLGPAGTPVVVEGNVRNKYDLIDGTATVARRILSLGDPRLDIGAMIVRNVVWRVSQRAGDGGATAAVLLNAILQGGQRQITAGANAMQLVRGIRLGMEVATNTLLAQARPCGDETQLAAAARTVTRDDDLSAMLGEMSYLLGPDAPVQIETYVAPTCSASMWPARSTRPESAPPTFTPRANASAPPWPRPPSRSSTTTSARLSRPWASSTPPSRPAAPAS